VRVRQSTNFKEREMAQAIIELSQAVAALARAEAGCG
jgi:hypothetical protein